MIDLAQPQRQSKLAVLFLAIRIVRRLGIAQLAFIVLFVVNGPFDLSIAALVSLAIVALGALSLLAWWRFTFQLEGGELVVNRGVFSTRRLSIPVERIQSLSIEQELLHRIVGLVKVTVDTAGSESAEFTIDAIDRPVAEQLQRDALVERRAAIAADPTAAVGGAPPVDTEQVVFAHPPARLLRAGLTMWPLTGLAVLGSLFAASGVLGDRLEESVIDVDPDGFRWWWIPVGIVVLVSLGVVLNLARVVFQDWDLTLRSGDRSLRRTSGLISLTSRASSVDRVQVVSTRQNPLQAAAGIADVDLQTVGDGRLSLIGCDDEQVRTVRGLAEVDVTPTHLDRRIHPAEIWLRTRNTAIVALVVGLAVATTIGWFAVLAVIAPVLAWLVTRRRVASARWGLGDQLARFDHVLDRTTSTALLHKANAVTVSQSLFERRRGLASVALATAAGTVEIGMIPVAEAEAVRDLVLHRAESDDRAWM